MQWAGVGPSNSKLYDGLILCSNDLRNLDTVVRESLCDKQHLLLDSLWTRKRYPERNIGECSC